MAPKEPDHTRYQSRKARKQRHRLGCFGAGRCVIEKQASLSLFAIHPALEDQQIARQKRELGVGSQEIREPPVQPEDCAAKAAPPNPNRQLCADIHAPAPPNHRRSNTERPPRLAHHYRLDAPQFHFNFAFVLSSVGRLPPLVVGGKTSSGPCPKQNVFLFLTGCPHEAARIISLKTLITKAACSRRVRASASAFRVAPRQLSDPRAPSRLRDSASCRSSPEPGPAWVSALP